MESNQIMN